MKFDFTRSFAVGASAGGMTYFRYPNGTLSLYGQSMPLWAGVGISVVVGSLVSEMLHSYVFPNISSEDRLNESVSMATGIGMTAGATTGVLYLSSPVIVSELGLANIAIASIGAELVGDWINRKVIKGHD